MSEDAKCKICRRAGEKLFLKGERCFTPKCGVVRKPYAPGVHGKRRGRALSEYGRQLREKQKLKALYGLTEAQFRRYVVAAAAHRGRSVEELMAQLERRLDNVVFRTGIAFSRSIARQLTSHGHITVNGKRITIPSYAVRPGDIIGIRKESADKPPLKEARERIKKYTPPGWIDINRELMQAKIARTPSPEDIGAPPADMQTILEYYSR